MMIRNSVHFAGMFPVSGPKEKVKTLIDAMQAQAKAQGIKTLIVPESENHRVFDGNQQMITNILYTGRDAENIEPYFQAMELYEVGERRYGYKRANEVGVSPRFPAFEPTRRERETYQHELARYQKKQPSGIS